MGKFANEEPGQGLRLGPPVPLDGEDGFAALGKPVPIHRRAAAERHCKDMGCTDSAKVFHCIEAMCIHIENDEPHAAMERALGPSWGGHPEGIVDATGVYRLLAVLLCAEKQQPETAA